MYTALGVPLARAWGRAGDEVAGWITWFEMDRP